MGRVVKGNQPSRPAKTAQKPNMLPTPAASSATSWSNASTTLSSPPLCSPNDLIQPAICTPLLLVKRTTPSSHIQTRRSLRRTARPQMLQAKPSTSVIGHATSSWPFNLAKSHDYLSTDAFISSVLDHYYRQVNYSTSNQPSIPQLKLALKRQFPYAQAWEQIKNPRVKNYLTEDVQLDGIMMGLAKVYSGSNRFDLQKQTEIAFCSWTSLLHYCTRKRIQSFETQLPLLTAAATIFQAKLMDEADVNIPSLVCMSKSPIKGMDSLTIKQYERKLADALQFKALYPTPHVLLYLFLDNLEAFIPIPRAMKLVSGLVLDELMKENFVRSLLLEYPQLFPRVGGIVFGVLFEVFAFFYIEVRPSALMRGHLMSVFLSSLDSSVQKQLNLDEFKEIHSEENARIIPQLHSQAIIEAIQQVRNLASS